MFFVASKVFWMLLSPIVGLLVLALLGASWSGDRWRRTFRSIGAAAILVLIDVAVTPVGLMVVAPLENRFPQPAADLPRPGGARTEPQPALTGLSIPKDPASAFLCYGLPADKAYPPAHS